MIKTQRNFASLASFLVLGMALIFLVAPNAAAQKTTGPQDVHIVNAATDPIPVKIDPTTNTVKIDGTTNTVKAAQTGTWNVGITGTPSVGLAAGATVQIGNTPGSPALVRNVDRRFDQPVRVTLNSTFGVGAGATTPNTVTTVPFGKRLIIEFVTAIVVLPNAQSAMFARLDSTGGFNEYITLTPMGNDGSGKPNFVASQKVFVIFEPGMVLDAFGFRNSGTDTGTVTMTISGYLMDL